MREYEFRTCVEINLNKLQQNLMRIRELAGKECKLMEVLKADAYGHGIRLCSRYADPFVDWFAVATIEEALAIRSEGSQKPLLVFGRLLDKDIYIAAENHITVSLFSCEYAEHVQSLMEAVGKNIDGHIKIDSGMNRLGLRARVGHTEEAVRHAKQILNLKNIKITGIYTHFACADTKEPSDVAFSDDQFKAFCQVCENLEREGFHTGIRHCVSTGGVICHPDYRMDMIRTGMLPLGQSISEESAKEIGVEPILTWYARIVDIHELSAGESISYGRIYKAKNTERIAVISVGYADGYARAFSSHTEVIIREHRVPVRGKICMDFIMADITDVKDAKIGDQVIVLGKSNTQWISADFLSAQIPFGANGGITAGISTRVPRIYLYNDEIYVERYQKHKNTKLEGTKT